MPDLTKLLQRVAHVADPEDRAGVGEQRDEDQRLAAVGALDRASDHRAPSLE